MPFHIDFLHFLEKSENYQDTYTPVSLKISMNLFKTVILFEE